LAYSALGSDSIGQSRKAEQTTRPLSLLCNWIAAGVFVWIFYATLVPLVKMFWRAAPLPLKPVAALEPSALRTNMAY